MTASTSDVGVDDVDVDVEFIMVKINNIVELWHRRKDLI